MGRGWKIALGVVIVVATLLGINALTIDNETKPAEVTVPDGKILNLPGGDLQVVERGPHNGSPIVLIHCYTCAIDWWNEMIPLLDRTHRVIAVDLLGFGGSEKPGAGYAMQSQATMVAQALSQRARLPGGAHVRARAGRGAVAGEARLLD
jgi:pimeloyl-ACP methyl ester carboxylesterase